MNLVFRLGELGFSLPVDDLAEIVEMSAAELDSTSADPSRRCLGRLRWRRFEVELFELWSALGLQTPCHEQGQFAVLVLAGKDGYWSLAVNAVEGIFPGTAFTREAIPPLLTGAAALAFDAFWIWREEPLHGCSALLLEAFREAA